jgi:hypothetical protein
LPLPPSLWRCGRHCGGMTGVMLDRDVALMLLFAVHGRVRPISGNGHRGGGPHGSLPCQRALRVPQARQKYAKRVRRSHVYVAGVGRGRDCSRRGIGVGRFDDVMGARARWKPALSLGRLLTANTLLTSLVGYAYYQYSTPSNKWNFGSSPCCNSTTGDD